jgi:two-component system, cell cycle sensor histidine kinase and response regulator CckA
LRLIESGMVVPDLVLTDVIMPRMNGRELHERLERILPGIRVIYMSGYSHAIVSGQGILNKGARLLRKPFAVNELLVAVRETLDEKNAANAQNSNDPEKEEELADANRS